jgi:hypothetical protein
MLSVVCPSKRQRRHQLGIVPRPCTTGYWALPDGLSAAGREDSPLQGSRNLTKMRRLAHLSVDILGETGEYVHSMRYRPSSYAEPMPLVFDVRTDSIDQ